MPRIAAPKGVLAHDAEVWAGVPQVVLAHFHARSSGHRPRVIAQLAHSGEDLHLRYAVEDRYVRSVRTRTNDSVCCDSCVEFFVEPIAGGGYFNFEMNAGGTLLGQYHVGPPGARQHRDLDPAELAEVLVQSTLPRVVEPEITEPITWFLTARIPMELMNRTLGRRVPVPGTWRANFYKCADETSHPHWGCWSPIGEELSFHRPEYFGELELK